MPSPRPRPSRRGQHRVVGPIGSTTHPRPGPSPRCDGRPSRQQPPSWPSAWPLSPNAPCVAQPCRAEGPGGRSSATGTGSRPPAPPAGRPRPRRRYPRTSATGPTQSAGTRPALLARTSTTYHQSRGFQSPLRHSVDGARAGASTPDPVHPRASEPVCRSDGSSETPRLGERGDQSDHHPAGRSMRCSTNQSRAAPDDTSNPAPV
jgi:hypothetical protein